MNTLLLRAYRSSQYEAAGIPVFIGRLSPAMDALLERLRRIPVLQAEGSWRGGCCRPSRTEAQLFAAK
jgi:hypothetical protein